jgi:hypothetical protein
MTDKIEKSGKVPKFRNPERRSRNCGGLLVRGA